MYEAAYVRAGSRKSRTFETYEEAFDFLDSLLDRDRRVSLAVIKRGSKVVTTLKF